MNKKTFAFEMSSIISLFLDREVKTVKKKNWSLDYREKILKIVTFLFL